MQSTKLAGKVALVTGASKGIGAAIAQVLAAAGARVVVNYASSRAGAERVVSAIQAAGGQALAIGADVANAVEVERLMTETVSAYGKLDILVNNAGLYQPAPLGQITEADFHRHFNLNVLGVILTTQAALPHFPPEGGVIVQTSSVVATLCPPGIGGYSATKAALDALTRTFARELAPRRIRVNGVSPGLIATEGTHAVGFVQPGSEEVAGLGRVGQPEHIANGVRFLASDDSAWMNGENLVLTGGTF